jgi:ABC-type lipoprotein release transport system permease subunit
MKFGITSFVRPGDDVNVDLPDGSRPEAPKFRVPKLTVVDLYESKMSEYDSYSRLCAVGSELQDAGAA